MSNRTHVVAIQMAGDLATHQCVDLLAAASFDRTRWNQPHVWVLLFDHQAQTYRVTQTVGDSPTEFDSPIYRGPDYHRAMDEWQSRVRRSQQDKAISDDLGPRD